MKKIYTAPTATATHISCENMIAASMDVGGGDHVTDEGQVLSIERGWDSSNWTTKWGDEE